MNNNQENNLDETQVLSNTQKLELENADNTRTYLDLDLDTVANGRYKYLHDIGYGGMGTVILAKDNELEREVAIKVLDADKRDEYKTKTERFIYETKITASLTHPGIVPVYDWGETKNGHFFFIMPLVEGVTMREQLSKINDSTSTRAKQTSHLLTSFLKICQAVAYAHFHQIIHLDLKPTNIMEGPFGEIYVMDWGLAKHCGDPELPIYNTESKADISTNKTSGNNKIMGTPGYMSPEQYHAGARRILQTSDVFSLGIILHEILVGEKPFKGNNKQEIQFKVIKNQREMVKNIAKHKGLKSIPKELIAICEKCLNHDPTNRYLSARALADDIQAYLDNRAVTAFQESPYHKFKRWQRHHGIANIVLVLFIIFILSIIGQWSITLMSNKKLISETKIQITRYEKTYNELNRKISWRTNMLLHRETMEDQRVAGLEIEQNKQTTSLLFIISRLRDEIRILLNQKHIKNKDKLTSQWRELWLHQQEISINIGLFQQAAQELRQMQKKQFKEKWWRWSDEQIYRLNNIKYKINDNTILNEGNNKQGKSNTIEPVT